MFGSAGTCACDACVKLICFDGSSFQKKPRGGRSLAWHRQNRQRKFGWYHWMCEKFNIFGMEKHTTHNRRGYICIGHISLETIFIYRGLIDDDLAPVSSDGLSLIQCQTTIQAIDGRMFWHLHASPKLPVLRIYLIPLDGYEMIIRSNIGTGKGLVPSGKKPLPESKLTKVRDALLHH